MRWMISTTAASSPPRFTGSATSPSRSRPRARARRWRCVCANGSPTCSGRAPRVFAGKHGHGRRAEQQEINELLIDRAGRGRLVVRLKGGDPFVFGRGAEECEALRAAGIAVEVVPGVTSAIAAPGAAGIPVTHRRHASGFAVVTGHQCDGASDLDWEALARMPTLVVLMGLSALPEIAARLLAHGAHPDTPAAAIADGTLPTQRTEVGTLA